MLHRTWINITLALVVVLIAGVALAYPPFPPWPYENDPRVPSTLEGGMDCKYIQVSSEWGNTPHHEVFRNTADYIPQQWCDNLALTHWREPNCVRPRCLRRSICMLCISAHAPRFEGGRAYVADNGCLRYRCTALRKRHPPLGPPVPFDPNKVIIKPQ